MMFTYKAVITVVLVSLWAFLLPAWISWFTDRDPTPDTAAASSLDQTDGDVRLASYAPASSDVMTYNDIIYSYQGESGVDTPAGTHVIAVLPDVVVDFETITAGGISSVITTSENPVGTSIPNFYVLGGFIDIFTTATYSGKIALGLRYEDHNVPNEQALRLLHWNGTEWEDATTWVDSDGNTVYGEVNSLSWFFIGGEWVWAEEVDSVLASVIGKTMLIVDEFSNVWITNSVEDGGECDLDKTYKIEVSECGQEIWDTCEWIMDDSIISWKFWLPQLVNITKGLAIAPGAED